MASSGASVFAKHPTIPFLFVGQTDSTAASVDPIVYCIFRGNGGAAPSTDANTYHHGCLAVVVDGTGNVVYQNTGSYASPTWSLLDTGTGFSLPTVATDTTTTTGTSFALTANSVTTGILQSLTANGLTTGQALAILHTTSVLASGGSLLEISSTSVDTGTTHGVLLDLTSTASTAATQSLLTASALTTGIADQVVAAALTSGIIYDAVATAATLTTGFYYAANDGVLNVFTVGANGHITSNQTTAPTTSVGTQAGITAVAITAGSSDVAGTITTTGTSTGGTIFTVTFNKTYTAAPKFVSLQPVNANAAAPNTQPFVSSITATTFVVTIPAGGTYAATPSYRYLVVA